VPPEFVHDYESVPIFRGSSKKGGVGHDYLSRKDSVPVVTKKVAAQVYFEVMEYVNVTEVPRNAWFRRFRFWWRRWLKYGVVRVWPGYFHKHKVMATYEEMSGRKEHKIQDAGSMMQDSGSRIQETD